MAGSPRGLRQIHATNRDRATDANGSTRYHLCGAAENAMTPYLLAIVITIGTVLVESVSAGAHPMQKLRALHQPRWSPPPSAWVLIGLLWYAICFIALVRLFRIEPPPLEVVGLLIALMLANAFANVPQFRLQRLDAAFFYLFPYWVLLGIFLGRVRKVDVTVAALFGLYAVYQVYAGFWAWRLWRLNASH